jgi:hypothetical protein
MKPSFFPVGHDRMMLEEHEPGVNGFSVRLSGTA